MSQDDLERSSADLERRLGSLAPRAADDCRDRLMYEAGRRSEQRKLRGWQSAAGGLAALLAAALLVRPAQREAGSSVTAANTAQSTTNPAAGFVAEHETPGEPVRPAYLLMRQAVLNGGIEAMEVEPPHRTTPDAPTMLDIRLLRRGGSTRDGGKL